MGPHRAHGQGSMTTVAATRPILVVAALVVLAVVTSSLAAFGGLWHRQPFEDLPRQYGGWAGAIVIFLCAGLFHELLHVVGWKTFVSVKWSEFSLRRSRRKLGVIAQVEVPVPVAAFRIGLLAPAILLGVGPILIAVAAGFWLMLLLGKV